MTDSQRIAVGPLLGIPLSAAVQGGSLFFIILASSVPVPVWCCRWLLRLCVALEPETGFDLIPKCESRQALQSDGSSVQVSNSLSRPRD